MWEGQRLKLPAVGLNPIEEEPSHETTRQLRSPSPTKCAQVSGRLASGDMRESESSRRPSRAGERDKRGAWRRTDWAAYVG